MKVSEILMIAVAIVKAFEDNQLLDAQGQFSKDLNPQQLAKISADIVSILKSHAVPMPENVEKVVSALPLILPLLIK